MHIRHDEQHCGEIVQPVLIGQGADRSVEGMHTFHFIRYSTMGRLYSFMTTLRPSISSTSATFPRVTTSTAGAAAHVVRLCRCWLDDRFCDIDALDLLFAGSDACSWSAMWGRAGR